MSSLLNEKFSSNKEKGCHSEKLGKFFLLRYEKYYTQNARNRWRENLAKIQVKNLSNPFWLLEIRKIDGSQSKSTRSYKQKL
jgi:hypothetical protein